MTYKNLNIGLRITAAGLCRTLTCFPYTECGAKVLLFFHIRKGTAIFSGVKCKGRGDLPEHWQKQKWWRIKLGELPQVHPIMRALSGTPPRTRQVVGEEVALGVLAALEARMRFEGKGERVKDEYSNKRETKY